MSQLQRSKPTERQPLRASIKPRIHYKADFSNSPDVELFTPGFPLTLYTSGHSYNPHFSILRVFHTVIFVLRWASTVGIASASCLRLVTSQSFVFWGELTSADHWAAKVHKQYNSTVHCASCLVNMPRRNAHMWLCNAFDLCACPIRPTSL